MTCMQAKTLFSPYLDGAITGAQMHSLTAHLGGCKRCSREYEMLRQTQQLLGGIGRKRAPEDLALRLRVAISQEVARSAQPLLAGLWVRFENAVRVFTVPAMAGLFSAVAVFGVLLGSMAIPLQANNSDVPGDVTFTTAPELMQSQFDVGLESMKYDSLVIEAYVNARGRVDGYRILSGPRNPNDLSPQVKNMLIFTTFRPATSMGAPTSGRAILSFSKIDVKG